VLTENEVAIQHRPFEIRESDPFTEYREAGGILEENVFDEALKAFRKKEQAHKFGFSTEQQAKSFAAKFRFELTPQQSFLYCFLREEEKLMTLPDQKVFAETLLMTRDFRKYSKFTLAYPQIYNQ